MVTIDFKLNENTIFSFLDKTNYEFDKFSYIDIILKYNNKNLELYKDDYLQEALDNLLGGFRRVIENKLIFPDEFNFNKGIYYYNELYLMSLDGNAEQLKIDYPKYNPIDKISWLLSTNNIYQTFLYSYKNEFYLEIAKSQEFQYDKNDNMNIDFFNQWLKDYSISFRFKIDLKEIKLFLKNLQIEFKDIYPYAFT